MTLCHVLNYLATISTFADVAVVTHAAAGLHWQRLSSFLSLLPFNRSCCCCHLCRGCVHVHSAAASFSKFQRGTMVMAVCMTTLAACQFVQNNPRSNFVN